MNRSVVAVLGFTFLAGCNDSRLVGVPLDNEGPQAVISGGDSLYQPLDTAQFSALDSTDPDGAIVGYAWEITDRPIGSNAEIQLLDGGELADFFVDLAGDYTIRLVVTDDDGASDAAEFQFSAVPWDAVHVQLTWNVDRADVDLHLVNESMNGAFYAQPWDCFFANPEPNWGIASQAVDDPSLDIDDTEGYGPENINVDEPQSVTQYHVYVHYYSDDGMGATTARIRIYVSGDIKWEGTKVLSGTGKVWDVGTIDWPNGNVVPDGSVFNHAYFTGASPSK